ncbi:hypothetical protein M758_12G035900 [Ceratodon purpureus]|uniref:Uncharacterized protein n=1 Tax=Ceratodon purpureus TaxID=3225 RepID=A0A8T0G354_CERPU|nr:hypothetical protein KC19_12G035300 [Ceratodon purpureus]KAG0597989.1 hypothetical protein M758_12G035900 [Ceratodon purpureus]
MIYGHTNRAKFYKRYSYLHDVNKVHPQSPLHERCTIHPDTIIRDGYIEIHPTPKIKLKSKLKFKTKS